MHRNRMEIRVRGGDADGDPALLTDLLGGGGDDPGTLAHALGIRLQIDDDKGFGHNRHSLLIFIMSPRVVEILTPFWDFASSSETSRSEIPSVFSSLTRT